MTEVECRLGNMVSPGHYARCWHITATCGARVAGEPLIASVWGLDRLAQPAGLMRAAGPVPDM